jgi:uncharacterized OB-fold protein
MANSSKGADILISNERPRNWRYTYSAGPIRSRFLLYLRDHQKIMGTRCSLCGRVYVPARSICLECYKDMKEWVEVSKRGVLQTYTIVYKQSPIISCDRSFAMGVIKLDGADTGIIHKLGQVEFTEIRIGMRLEAVFANLRKGDIRDIVYFKPI